MFRLASVSVHLVQGRSNLYGCHLNTYVNLCCINKIFHIVKEEKKPAQILPRSRNDVNFYFHSFSNIVVQTNLFALPNRASFTRNKSQNKKTQKSQPGINMHGTSTQNEIFWFQNDNLAVLPTCSNQLSPFCHERHASGAE